MTNKTKKDAKKRGKKTGVVVKQAVKAVTRKMTIPRGMQVSPHCKKAIAAAMNPFHPSAEGVAEVDDSFSRNLLRFPISYGAKVRTNASGEISLVILPNLYCSGLCPVGTLNGPTSYAFSADSDTNVPRTARPTVYPTPTMTSVNGVMAMPGLFATQYAKHRIVRWGVVIRTIPNMSTNQGRIRLAKIQAGGYAPMTVGDLTARYVAQGDEIFTGLQHAGGVPTAVVTSAVDSGTFLQPYVPTLARWLYNVGVPVTNPGSTVSTGADVISITSDPNFSYEDLARMPGNVSMTVAGLTAQGLLVRGKRTDINQLRGTMLSAATAGGSVSSHQLETLTMSANNSFQTANYMGGFSALDIGVLDCTGHDGLVIKVDSAAATTDLLDIELIYHIEASLRGNAGNTFGRAAAEPVLTTPADAHAVRAVESRASHFVAVPTAFREILNGAVEGLGQATAGRIQSALSGTLSGVLTRALAGITL